MRCFFLKWYSFEVLFEHLKTVLHNGYYRRYAKITSYIDKHRNEASGLTKKRVEREIFEIIDTTYLVKLLRKLSKIKGDKNFLKPGEVDVIKIRPLIKIFLILMVQ